ncbi:hypothetical protein, partial [Salmonella sp. gx-f7]|uniref:hypothetical protein n=1 Tax=Salmonella sp. gx-f7 TaxID=2582606 RepID=UPI001F3E8A71
GNTFDLPVDTFQPSPGCKDLRVEVLLGICGHELLNEIRQDSLQMIFSYPGVFCCLQTLVFSQGSV